MTDYEFRCDECGVYTRTLDPATDALSEHPCRCGRMAARVYSAQIGYIDFVNPDRGDGVNLGLGKWFKSAAERENWAKANGYEKLDR